MILALYTARKKIWRFGVTTIILIVGGIGGWYAKSYHIRISKTWAYQWIVGKPVDEPVEKVTVTEKVSDGTVTIARIPGKAWHAFREEFDKPSETKPKPSPSTTQPTTKPSGWKWPFYLKSKPGPG